KLLAVDVDESDRHVVSLRLSRTNPPDVFFQSTAASVLHRELIDRSRKCKVDGIEDGALARTVATAEHGKACGEFETGLVSKPAKTGDFDIIELHVCDPSKRTTSIGETSSSRATFAAAGAMVAICLFKRSVRSSSASCGRYWIGRTGSR